jgi:hypothetical protein
MKIREKAGVAMPLPVVPAANEEAAEEEEEAAVRAPARKRG